MNEAQGLSTAHNKEAGELSGRSSSIDALRFVLAFMVVCIHYPSSLYGDIVEVISRVAVPLFFMISGYFTYNVNVAKMKQTIKKTLPHIATITAWALPLYFLWGIPQSYFGVTRGGISLYIAKIFDVKALIKLVVFNEPPFGGQLWYLLAYLYVLIIYYFACGSIQKHLRAFVFVSLVLLAVFALIPGYCNVMFGDGWMTEITTGRTFLTRNAWFDGFPCFTLGFALRKILADRSVRLSKHSTAILLVCLMLFSVTAVAEHRLIDLAPHFYFSTLPAAICILILALGHKNILSGTPIPALGRKYSLYIYVFHGIVGSVSRTISGAIHIEGLSYVLDLCMPVIVFALSLLASMLFVSFKLPKKTNLPPEISRDIGR